jgi:hypothetical protein
LNEVDEKLEKLKFVKDLNQTNNDNTEVLLFQNVQNLIDELEEATLLKDILKVKDIEDKLTALK